MHHQHIQFMRILAGVLFILAIFPGFAGHNTAVSFAGTTPTFTDMASTAGVNDGHQGRDALFDDYDGDGDLDIYLVNFDSTNRLYNNKGNGTFGDVTKNAGLTDAGKGAGAAAGDYDGDGDLDLYLVNFGSANRLYQNNGKGVFTDVGASAGVADAGNGSSAAFGDYDGDGDLDLYLVNNGSANKLYRNNGDGTFTDVAATARVNDGHQGRDAIFVDYDIDGDLDIYLVNSGSTNRLFRNNGNGTFTDVTSTAGVTNVASGRGAASGDYDNDGDPDIYLVNSGSANRLYQNNGDGTFTDVAATAGVADAGSGMSAALGDCDNDGDLDLYLVNNGSANKLYQNNGNGTFTDVAVSAGAADAGKGWSAVFGDYDNDGNLDIYLVNEGSANRLYRNNASPTTYMDVAAEVGLVLSHELNPNVCDPPIGSGSAWADYDNDGDVDLYVTNHGGPNPLYRNDGDTDGDGLPNLTDVAAALGVDDPTGVGHGAVFIDYDNDGDQDLYVTNWGGNTLYQNQLIETGSAGFVDVTATAGVGDSGRAVTAAWGDFDADGYLDVYLAKHFECMPTLPNNQDRLFHNNGDGTFTDVTHWLCGGPSSCSQVLGLGFSAGWFDYDDDKDLDLYVVNDNIQSSWYPNVLWRNDGSDGAGGWVFTDVSSASGANISLNGMGLGIGDFNNDKRLDLAFSNMGPNYLLQNNGDGTFSDVSASAGIQRATLPGGGMSITWGTAFFDHDNDGWLDLLYVAGYLGPVQAQPNAFFGNNGDGTFTDLSSSSGLNDPGRGRNASSVDFDGDGFVDVFIGNYGEPPVLFHNRSVQLGNTNNWLTVTVQGTVSNRDGIGAQLRLTLPDGMVLTREINSGTTHGSGDHRAAYFGLGSHATGDLRVRWPTGVVEHLGTVTANQRLHVVEGQGIAAAAPVPRQLHAATQLEPNYPNPFNPETWIPYRLAKEAFVTVTLYDLRGNVVRTLDVGHQRAGVYVSKDKALHWDGRNDSGERVASGVYFYTLTTDNFTATRKMLILK